MTDDAAAARGTRQVIEAHLHCRQTGDLEGDLRDNYDPDVVLLSWGEGLHRGADGVRHLASVLRSYDVGRYDYDQVLTDGDVAMLNWHAPGDAVDIHDGADSYVVRDGRIRAQTIHYSTRRQDDGSRARASGVARSDVTSFDGTRLATATWGDAGAPTVVLVHGLGLSMESWGPVPQLLADSHRVVAYDLRGHAQSGDARSGGYSMSAQARDLDQVLRAVVPDGEKAVVVGNSLGGGIILARAQEHGVDRMAGVVFAGSGGSGVTFPGFPADGLPDWARDRLRAGWIRVLRGTALVGRRIRPVQGVSDRLIRGFAFTSHPPHDAVAQVRDSFLSSRPQVLAATTLASVSHDGTRMAPALAVPALVLHGTEDPEVDDEELQGLLSALPDVELVDLPGEGHMLGLTDPETVADHVSRWVQHVGLTHRP